jgi:endonuclease-3 related protein
LEKPLEKSRAELLTLDGIGKETADSILLYAGNQSILPIDAYTLRVMARVMDREGDYDSLQVYLQEMLPRELDIYREFHALIVEHAKKTCLNAKPNCANCRVDPCLYNLERY